MNTQTAGMAGSGSGYKFIFMLYSNYDTIPIG